MKILFFFLLISAQNRNLAACFLRHHCCQKYGFKQSIDALMMIFLNLRNTDIDECAHPAKYPCYGVCKDTQGSYQCTCHPGYESFDPKTGPCAAKFPLAAQISIGNLRQTTLNVLVLLIISSVKILFLYVHLKQATQIKQSLFIAPFICILLQLFSASQS